MVSTTATSIPLAPTQTLSVPGTPALELRVWGRKPRGHAVPLVLHFHGGAFVSGDLDSGACLAELLARSGAVVASLAYPLAPAHRFPDAVEAGYTALEWLYKQRTRLAGKDAPLFVAGEEAGGNIAAAVAMMVRDRAHPPLAGQILVAPMLDPCNATASLRQTMGKATCCKWMDGWQQYLRGPMDAEHPYAVPCRAQRLAGLPPTLILTGDDDPMRDEALAYAERLREAGIAVHGGVLQPATGWPDSLSESPVEACPCAGEVREHLRAFYQAATPPPPS
ncbi:MAG: alpha/beta hydrolase [Hydrogenophaga sp.]|uniref:alpha/beta hydrolase n=1 Tax=Hydrogenophaga sp. TaxID=1904254 RepID=UPI0026251872|nr:alpha/beta hydrolase [Hydrogenophaga sp.]MCV0439389.1 alpha/beta hydrolase [Hydrogenophaga sp.]